MVDRHFASGGIHPCDEGEWVSYDDYAALEARADQWEKDAARFQWLLEFGSEELWKRLSDMSLYALVS